MSQSDLVMKIQFLERSAEQAEKSRKYIHNMIEDLGTRFQGLERSASRFEIDLTHRNLNDKTKDENMKEIFDRLRMLERLIYVGIGGVIVLSGAYTLVSAKILKLLSS